MNRPARPGIKKPDDSPMPQERLYVRVKEAQKLMGMGHTSIYKEIKDGRLLIKKSGKKTLIAVSDIHAWFDSLPENTCTPIGNATLIGNPKNEAFFRC